MTLFVDCPLASDSTLAAEGWRVFEQTGTSVGFNQLYGDLYIRACADGSGETRVETGPSRANPIGGLHGAFMAALIEMNLQVPLYIKGSISRGAAVVVEVSIHYLEGGTTAAPLIAHTRLRKETGRMGFVTGELRQGDAVLAGYSGIVRKLRSA